MPRIGGRAGFTLIEVMVAIVVALVLGGGFVRFFTGVRATAVRAEESTQAWIVARAVGEGATATAGDSTGESRGFRWRLHSEAMADVGLAALVPAAGTGEEGAVADGEGGAATAAVPTVVPYRITVTVTAPRGTEVRLETVRLGAAATEPSP